MLATRREPDELLLRDHVGGIRKRGRDVLTREPRVAVEQLGLRGAFRQLAAHTNPG